MTEVDGRSGYNMARQGSSQRLRTTTKWPSPSPPCSLLDCTGITHGGVRAFA